MPYKRRKPFHIRYQAAFVNAMTVLVFAALILIGIVLVPDAIEQLQTMKEVLI